MANTSDVKSALSEIAEKISDGQIVIANTKQRLQNAYNILESIPVTFSDELAEIDGYTPVGAFETLAKDEKAKLTVDFQTLKTTIGDLLDEFPV